MKKIQQYILLCLMAAGGVLTFSACQNIEPTERFVPMEDVTVNRAVLIEDFTGQLCPNCPSAHNIIEKLQEEFGDAVIPVSIHPMNSGFGISVNNTAIKGLALDEANEYSNAWKIGTYPSGLVNRDGGVMLPVLWAKAVRDQIKLPSAIDLSIESAVVENNEIKVEVKMLSSADVNCKLQLWVLESGIVGYQQDDLTLMPNYVHNNVYRASMNGLWGEEVDIKSNMIETFARSYEVESYWNTDNLRIVAFAYDEGAVIQATSARVKK